MGRASRRRAGGDSRDYPGRAQVEGGAPVLRGREVPDGYIRGAAGAFVRWDEALAHIGQTRLDLDELERQAVAAGRLVGASWDRLSGALGGRPTGEQLRRRHSGAAPS